MKFGMEIHLDNAAFQPEPAPELGRLIADVANRLINEPGLTQGNLYDANGNFVGGWRITPGLKGRGPK